MTERTLDRRTLLRTAAGVGIAGLAGCTDLFDDDNPADLADLGSDGSFEISEVVSGLTHPWGLAFVPGTDDLLVTERDDGVVQLVDRDEGSAVSLPGTPEVFTGGQGGLLDIAVHPEYPAEPWLYLTYSATNDAGESATHLGRGRLDTDDTAIHSFEQIHVAEPYVDSGGHFGSRVVFGPDGMVYVTTGDRQFKDFGPDHVSQDTTNELGATLRLEPDGSIPADNPFVEDPDVVDSIFTYGHRNAQGMAVHPETDEIWQSEHGEEDGDEINIVRGGGNYGWPVTHTGCRYGTDDPVGEDPRDREDIVDPVYFWECTTGGFPPAGATFYDGDAFPEWSGDLFVGNLAGQYLGRFTVENPDAMNPDVTERDPLLADAGWRIRDVAVAPDSGHLYAAVDAGDAMIVRLHPE